MLKLIWSNMRLEQAYGSIGEDKAALGRLLDLAEKLHSFVSGWWQDHIDTIDDQYVQYARERAA